VLRLDRKSRPHFIKRMVSTNGRSTPDFLLAGAGQGCMSPLTKGMAVSYGLSEHPVLFLTLSPVAGLVGTSLVIPRMGLNDGHRRHHFAASRLGVRSCPYPFDKDGLRFWAAELRKIMGALQLAIDFCLPELGVDGKENRLQRPRKYHAPHNLRGFLLHGARFYDI